VFSSFLPTQSRSDLGHESWYQSLESLGYPMVKITWSNSY